MIQPPISSTFSSTFSRQNFRIFSSRLRTRIPARFTTLTAVYSPTFVGYDEIQTGLGVFVEFWDLTNHAFLNGNR